MDRLPRPRSLWAGGLSASSSGEPTGSGMGASAYIRAMSSGGIVGVVWSGKADPCGEGIAPILLEPFGCLVADKAIDVEFALVRRNGCAPDFRNIPAMW